MFSSSSASQLRDQLVAVYHGNSHFTTKLNVMLSKNMPTLADFSSGHDSAGQSVFKSTERWLVTVATPLMDIGQRFSPVTLWCVQALFLQNVHMLNVILVRNLMSINVSNVLNIILLLFYMLLFICHHIFTLKKLESLLTKVTKGSSVFKIDGYFSVNTYFLDD